MEETKKSRFLNQPALAWILEAVKGNKRYIALLTCMQILVSLMHIGYSLLFRELIDRAVDKNAPGFRLFLILLAAAALLRIGVRALVRHVDEVTRASLENVLKQRLFSTLLSRDYSTVTAVHTGEWMNRLTSDTVVVANGLAQIIPNLGGMVVQMGGALCVIVIMQPVFGAIVVPAAIVFTGLTRLLRPELKRLHREIQNADGNVRILMQERLDNLLIVDAYSQREQSLRQTAEKMDIHRDVRMKRNFLTNLSQVGLGVAMQGMYLLGAGFCAWGILNGTVSYGTMTAVLQMISRLQAPFSGIGGYFSQWFAMLSSAERLMEAEKFRPEAAGVDADRSAKLYREDFRGIRTENMNFSYVDRIEGRELAIKLNYRDFRVDKGEFVALSGPSGCGKSTLLKLLMGIFHPDSGNRILMTAVGERELTASDRGLFAYVPQGNMLMSGTIRQIITFYDENRMKEDDSLWRALKVACADGFVRDLPQGLDTVLGEHGTGLSEGQIQRIAIARAIFSRRPILLLDEATSALDGDTEARLLHNLRTMTDRTVLIITHRPKAFEVCHRVVRMERGTVQTQEDTHD